MSDGGRAASIAHLEQNGVSRETLDCLDTYANLLRKWTARVNLISRGSEEDLWTRHILDSAQLFAVAPSSDTWVDLGSGGGLPGVVCAILARKGAPDTRFSLIESDRRKCAFLQTCARELDLPSVTVHPARIEAVPPLGAGVLSARALAPLCSLFALAEPHIGPNSTLLFLKGAQASREIDEAKAEWRFTVDALPSITDAEARILRCRLQGRIRGERTDP